MGVHLEKFDPQKFTTEKVSFQLSILEEKTFNISQGDSYYQQDIDEDGLRESPIWRGKRTTEEFRLLLWEECRKYLPEYLATRKRGDLGGYYLRHLLKLAESSLKRDITLIYFDDEAHAQLIKRCVEWLARQIDVPF